MNLSRGGCEGGGVGRAACSLVSSREKAKKKGNEQWISENKQNYIDEFGKKLDEYENKITELEADKAELVKILKPLILSYAGPVQTAHEAIELYDKFAEKALWADDHAYFAKAAEERKRMEEEAKVKNAA